jgi:protein SCO1/2
MSMNWRLASRLSVITFAILVVIFVLVFQQIKSGLTTTVSSITNGVSFAGLQGTDLGGTPAPNFQLTDQNGQTISLAQFKGHPVVLTFLYTNCPDLCPLTAEKLHQTMLALGNQANQIGVIAVSVDPKRDTQQAALTFSELHRMNGYWHYLIGTQQQLTPVWSSYNISSQPGQGATIDHSLGIYVIDKQGRERAFFDSTFDPAQLTNDLQVLLKQ